VAFAGTVIFPLYPISAQYFEESWNISVKELPDLIKFVHRTKKIQFALTANPKSYKNFDYLEPIFQEFSPPIYRSSLINEDEKFRDQLSICVDEINHLISFSPEWQNASRSATGRNMINIHMRSYALLRYYGFNEIADVFIENFLTDPIFAGKYLSIAGKIILHPIRDPLKANLAISVDVFNQATNMGITPQKTLKDISFPEVGSFLMKKCTYYPESLVSCDNLISQYKKNDLYAVNMALNHAIIDRNETKILETQNEMAIILDNIWNDNRLKRNATISCYGIEITVGTLGYCLMGLPGIFGSIGLGLLDRAKTNYLEHVSESIAKKIAQPSMITIYDFKKNYRLE